VSPLSPSTQFEGTPIATAGTASWGIARCFLALHASTRQSSISHAMKQRRELSRGELLRNHLGIRVPKDNPPLIRVAGREYVWKEGEGVIFDDSSPHEVVNHSREARVVYTTGQLSGLQVTLPGKASVVTRPSTIIVIAG